MYRTVSEPNDHNRPADSTENSALGWAMVIMAAPSKALKKTDFKFCSSFQFMMLFFQKGYLR